MDETHQLLEDMAHQPISYWGAAIVLASAVGGYLALRRLINSLREQNQQLKEMLNERDQTIKTLNEKLFELASRRRGQ